jgi:hypothetical protein
MLVQTSSMKSAEWLGVSCVRGGYDARNVRSEDLKVSFSLSMEVG